jgi:NADP-dependent 3-hydroxy acid dehydrogenase YdfG
MRTFAAMSNPVIIIVGAGPGVGAATARRFAADGYDIGLLARDAERLEAFAAELGRAGTAVHPAAVDIADAEALTATLGRMTERTGRLDVLLHNASAYRESRPSELSAADLANDLATGAGSLLTAVQAVLPVLRARQSGTVLVTGSGAADAPSPAAPSLGAQKAALRSLVQVLAAELGPEGIHVATLTVRGWIRPGTAFAPEAIAEIYADLVRETGSDPAKWRTVLDLTAAGVVTVTPASG